MEKASLIIKKCLLERGMQQKDLAKLLKKSQQNLNNKFYRDNFSYEEFVNILNLLNYKIKVVEKENNYEINDTKITSLND